MTKEMRDVKAAAPAVDMTVYVDDVGQSSSGSLHRLVEQLVAAGRAFKYGMDRLRLRIADKSVVVADCPKVGRLIKEGLCSAGVRVRVDSSGRDLGLLLNLGGVRRASLQQARHQGALRRLAKVKCMSEVTKRSRRLAVAGGLSKAAWGQAGHPVLSPACERPWRPPPGSISLAGAERWPFSSVWAQERSGR